MKAFVTTDIHLSDRKKDEYRFGLFAFIREQVKAHHCEAVLILGDITEFKDNHSSALVNRIVDELKRLAKLVPVYILKGNHDYHADPDNPFFKFLNHIDNIHFITEPTMVGSMFFIPHINNDDDWNNLKPDRRPTAAFIHQTVTGAISESGQRLDGASLRPLKRLKCRVFGGDVHHPHVVDPVIYVGPPYHVRFGDNFRPRCIILNTDTGKFKTVRYDCPAKWSITITDVSDLEKLDYLKAGDQVKVKLELPREEITDWQNHKQRIVDMQEKLGLESYGIELQAAKQARRPKEGGESNEVGKFVQRTPSDVLGGFCKREKLPRAFRKAGRELLK